MSGVASVASINDSYSLVLRERLFRGISSSLNSVGRWLYCTVAFPYAVNYEKTIYTAFQKVHVVSEVDSSYLKGLNPKIAVSVIPNGVDVEYFKPSQDFSSENSLVLIANFAVDEHVQNALWFLSRVYRKIRKRNNNVKLYLVGKDPPQELIYEASKLGAIVTGYVKDIRPYIEKATLVVDARWQRFGILNHILQSMAMEKCVVGTFCTFIAVKGVENWRNAVIAKNEVDFVSTILSLLENETLRDAIGKKARYLMESQYSWTKITPQYERMYKSAISKFAISGFTRHKHIMES